MRKYLFENALMITKENGIYTPVRGFLGVEDSTISYMGTERPREEYAERIDASSAMLLPGFVNCHGHSAMNLLRGYGSDLPLQEWLHTVWPVEDRLDEDDLRAGMELAIMEMLASGTTSFTDMYLMPWAVADTAGRSGIKCSLSRVMQAFGDEMSDSDYDSYYRVKEQEELFDRYNGSYDGRILVDYAIHAEYTCQPLVMRRYAEDCRKRGARMQVHLSETRKEHEECKRKYGMTPAALLNSLGVFDNPTLAAHCVHVEESDMEIMARKGVTVVHNPSSNMKLGSGFAPVPKMLEKGINVALGTDGAASNNNLDFLEEMHLASIIHNGYTEDAVVMNPSQILDMATVNGALAQGRSDTGALKVGMKADIVMLDTSSPHMVPMLNPLANLVYSAQSSDVAMTMVDGTILYRDGEFLTIDRERVTAEVSRSVKKLYNL